MALRATSRPVTFLMCYTRGPTAPCETLRVPLWRSTTLSAEGPRLGAPRLRDPWSAWTRFKSIRQQSIAERRTKENAPLRPGNALAPNSATVYSAAISLRVDRCKKALPLSSQPLTSNK